MRSNHQTKVGRRFNIMSAFRTIEAKPHTPVYTMHKYFARRPWNVFRELISHYTSPADLVLDPFCGGGVTIVESLKLRRKVVGVDINPLATYITKMEVRPVDLERFHRAFSQLAKRAREAILKLYSTRCSKCSSEAHADWIEWDEQTRQITRLRYECPICGSSAERLPTEEDVQLARKIDEEFVSHIDKGDLWYPRTPVPPGDKTSSLLSKNINHFYELFTKRNLLAFSLLFKEIGNVADEEAREFLKFALSSSLKWASRQSHLRGKIVEGWAMHAYWIYPRSLEINVWNTFERRVIAVARGKRYGNRVIGDFCRLAQAFDDLTERDATCLILTTSSVKLPIPDESIDSIITDPPYGGNVNYGELGDFWYVWLSGGLTMNKEDEVIINKTQNKSLEEYEGMLHEVFRECYRVLKPRGRLVSTFNSKDMRVVASFVTSASRAGFALHPDGFLYQRPIRAYTTTFHAMQIGAFVGDFVFAFVKEPQIQPADFMARRALDEFEKYVRELLDENLREDMAEPQLREMAYRALIPFLARCSKVDISACREAVDYFETEMRKREDYFREVRRKITEKRRERCGDMAKRATGRY